MTPVNKRLGLIYILPQYDPAASSHLFHIYEMISRASASGLLDMFVVIERSAVLSCDIGAPCHIQIYSWPPLRFLEMFFILTRERLAGRRHFYIHYSFYGAMAAWLVTAVLGGRAYYWNCGMPWLYRRSWFEELVFRFILRHALLVTGTLGMAAEYAKRYRLDLRRIRVLPNWVNLARFRSASDVNHLRERLDIPRNARVVLFVHRLSRRKGAHLLPHIIAGVIQQRKDAIFVIVGGGPEADNLKFEIRNLKLEKYVRLIGEVPHRDIHKYFKAADVFLMPSEEEGFPHVLLEAMAAGVPYVASDVGGVREITPPELQDFIVPNGDNADFAAKIIQCFALPRQELMKISVLEQEWVKRYDIQAVLPQFIKLFKF